MEPLVIKLNKTISTVPGELNSYRLILSVMYAQGVTDAIFVHQYFPGSPYAGATELSFYNVAYPDELHSIPINPPNKSAACYVRTNRIDKYFKSLEDIDSFLYTVRSDITRLLKYLETFNDLAESSSSCITITKDSNYEVPTADVGISQTAYEHSDGGSSEILDGQEYPEVDLEATETIVVDSTGR